MGSQRRYILPLRHGCAARHAGDDDRLADPGQCVFRAQRRRGSAKTGDSRRVIVGNVFTIQRVHLLPDGPVQTGIARVQTDKLPARGMRLPHDLKHLLQGHLRAVVN